jgi:hypothetical protein
VDLTFRAGRPRLAASGSLETSCRCHRVS